MAANTLKQMESALGLESSMLGADRWKHLSLHEDALQAQLRNMAQADVNRAMLGAQADTQPSGAASGAWVPALADRARELFLKRMGGIRAEMKVALGDFVQCHIHGEVVHVFYCFGGRAGVAQESIDLFPSDQLITQFRMVLST